MKRLVSIILIAAMLSTVLLTSALSAGAATYIIYGDWILEIDSDTTYLVGGYSGSDTELVFPSTANSKAVIGVSEDFYERCSSQLTSVTLPDSYTKIGNFAFHSMSSLESINIPASLSSLGAMVFNNCTALESADFSRASQLKTIPHSCFNGCESLDTVVFPESLTTISDYAFKNTAIESAILPKGVTTVGDESFSGCASLSQVVLPAGLATIGEEAFNNDTALTSVYVPRSVSSIGNNAFFPMAVDGGTLTLDCYEGSYAAEYAYQNYLNYTADVLVKGDANNDGKVNIRDVTYIQLYLVDRVVIADDAKTIERVDVTGDNKVSIRDATQIQLYRVGLVELV